MQVSLASSFLVLIMISSPEKLRLRFQGAQIFPKPLRKGCVQNHMGLPLTIQGAFLNHEGFRKIWGGRFEASDACSGMLRVRHGTPHLPRAIQAGRYMRRCLRSCSALRRSTGPKGCDVSLGPKRPHNNDPTHSGPQTQDQEGLTTPFSDYAGAHMKGP